ncbi:hypothetical protein BH10BAC5_BH10BAC5_03640 [soil metagenome]
MKKSFINIFLLFTIYFFFQGQGFKKLSPAEINKKKEVSKNTTNQIPPVQPPPKKEITKVIPNILRGRDGNKIDVIVIDPGHGGKDPGSTSISKIPEKNINLAIALKLKSVLEKEYDDIKVLMTRETDEFIDLKERGSFANKNKGKLFISIHSNSKLPEESEKTGFEVYIMDAAKAPSASKFTQSEDLILKSNTGIVPDEQSDPVYSAIKQSVNRKYSERFAEIVISEMGKNTKLESRGIMEQPFVVVTTASMPAILVECGYLSNTNDEAYLRSKEGQLDIALSIYKAVRYFKMDYDWENKTR